MDDEYHKMLRDLIVKKSKELDYTRRVTAKEIILQGLQLAYEKQFKEDKL